MVKKYIDPKRPPILWDTIEDAFGKINDNFTELYLTVGGGGAVDLSNISSSISPSESMTYDLGTPTNRWRRLYIGGGAIYVDNAPITATGTTLELPFGTKVGGVLVKDPTEGSFKNIEVFGQQTVVAENLKDTLNFVGNGITIGTNASTDTISFTNAGVLSTAAGAGISVSASTGAVTITNTGVTSIANGTGIGISAGTGSVTISNTGVTELIAGSNIILSNSTGAITITNGSPNINQNLWRFIAVSGQDTLDPASPNSTLTFGAGSNIEISIDSLTNTVLISSPNRQDIIGSIFADDSTMLVDGTGGKIVGPINSFDGANSISMTPSGVIIGGTGGAQVIGAAGAPVYLGAGSSGTTSGPVTIGHGGNTVTINNATVNGTLNGNVNGNVTGNLTGNVSGDLKGSVFAQDSSMIIDGTSGRVVGPVYTSTLRTLETKIILGLDAGGAGINAIAIGEMAGQYTQGNRALAIGFQAGLLNQGVRGIAIGQAAANANQGTNAIAIGETAGASSQGINGIAIGENAGLSNHGTNAIAIGRYAGANNQSANSIVINASGSTLDAAAAGFFVTPIREILGPQVLYYDPSNKEITWGPVPAGGGGGGGGGGDFELNVAGDDSTLRRIFSGETLKFVGSNGISTASDGEGLITITGPNNISGNASTATTATTVALVPTDSTNSTHYITFVDTASGNENVRTDTALTYNPSGNVLTATFVSSTQVTATTAMINNIDTLDSSAITVIPKMLFNSDVEIENELIVRNSVRAKEFITDSVGVPEVSSVTNLNLTAGNAVVITQSPLRLAKYTTAQRNLLTAQNGDMIYNLDTNKFQGYANSTWVDLH